MADNDYDDFASDEFIRNPSRFSQKTLSIAKEAAKKHYHLMDQKSFLDKVKKGVKMRLLYLEEYKKTLSWLEGFEIKGKDIEGLYEDFRAVSEKIALNNIMLAYSMSVEKSESPDIMTKEDEKIMSLHSLGKREISMKEFNKRFGHHALNPFEVSSKRFKEYDEKKLKMIAEGTPEPKVKDKYSIDDYRKKGMKEIFPIYNYLREELRDRGIMVVSRIRERLLEIEKKNDIKDVFSKDYEEVVKHEDKR